MKTENLKSVFSIITNVSVLAGLVFVGIEIRQNNELMEREARLNQVGIFRDIFDTQAQDPYIAPIMLKESSGEELTAEEYLRLMSHWMGVIKYFEWVYFDLPNDRRWISNQRANYTSSATYRQAWHGYPNNRPTGAKDRMDPEFTDFFQREVVGFTIE